MKILHAATSILILAVACAAGAQNPKQQDLKGMEAQGQRNDMTNMTAAQQAEYKAQYQAAKAKWAAMTPQEKSATIAAAKNKKLSDLTAIELVGQRDDMKSETAAQNAQYKAEAAAAKAKWDKLTPDQKKAVRRSAWSKKRADLDAMETVGQRDDDYVLPF